MTSRRNVLSGLAATALTGCSASQTARPTYVATHQYQTEPPHPPPPPDSIAPEPVVRDIRGLDAVIDLSAHNSVSDFRSVRASNILGVIHKASEGDFYADPVCAERRSQAEAAGLLWGTYHFGKGDSSGEQQAAFFLESSRPTRKTLLALDLEANEGDPSNSMTLGQAEAFVQAVANSTGRLPLVYIHPNWSTDGVRVTANSILARCGLWVVDYSESPRIPSAWASRGWQLWQYASGEFSGRRANGRNRTIHGVSGCDRNLFNGDAAALYRFWSAADA